MSFIKAITGFVATFVACQAASAQDSFWSNYDSIFDYELSIQQQLFGYHMIEYNRPLVHYSDSGMGKIAFASRAEADAWLAQRPDYDVIERRDHVSIRQPFVVVGIAGTWAEAQQRLEEIREQNDGIIVTDITPLYAPSIFNQPSNNFGK